jgi:uncharacterized membrane protein
MAIALALGAALAYGSADFVGGLASRRASALVAAFSAQVVGLLVLVAVLPLVATSAPAASHLGFGAIAGVFGGIGVLVLFRALARGPMSVVAPTTALAATLVPILAGVGMGERPGALTGLGIAVSLAAVVLITREPATVAAPSAARSVVPLALAGGSIFGLFFVFLHQAGPDAGLWPLLGARLASVPLLAMLVARQGGWGAVSARSEGSAWRAAGASGVLDMGANVLYLLALQHGMLAVVAAITGLYPASTVLLAQSHLRERLARPQVVGLGVAALAAVLIAVS